MKTYLYLSTAIVGVMIVGNVWAQCVSTQDCTALGYTETSCPNGGVKCPFGNKWFCGRRDDHCLELACDELGFKYDCVGTNIAGGEGTECNGKYVACKCASGYGWQDSSCQEIVMNGPDGDVYRCKGSVLGVKTADMDFYVAMFDSSTYDFCTNTPGVTPTKDQLLTIYKNHEKINELLLQYGGNIFDNQYYRSDTFAGYYDCSAFDSSSNECVDGIVNYYAVNVLDGKVGYHSFTVGRPPIQSTSTAIRKILTKF